jgi:O-antigen/teichoic acid export membrane protein
MMRWSLRFVGLFSMLILARILSPTDFGVAAMATVVIGFLYAFTEVGAAMHLIRAKEASRADCDTAWTITLVQHAFVGLMLAALAHPAAAYFGEPRVVPVIYVVALTAFVAGFANIGLILARRELKFDLDFRFHVYTRLVILVATVGGALYLRSYWAIVLGNLAGTATSVFLSYLMHPYRPRWSLEKLPEYLRFAMSIVPMQAANTVHSMISQFLVGGLGNAATMGAFTVSSSLARVFTAEVVEPMGRGLFPNYARLAADKARLSRVYRRVLGMVPLVVIPVGVGMSATATDVVAVLLGPQWESAASLIRYLAIGAVAYAVTLTMNNQILVATGHERSAAVLAWLRLGLTVPILTLGLTHEGALGLAKATIIAPLVCLPVIYMEIRRAVPLPLSVLAGLWWRPIMGALVMYLAVKALHPYGVSWAILRLAFDAAVGGIVYTGTVVLLWLASGRPNSAERDLMHLLRRGPGFLRSQSAA